MTRMPEEERVETLAILEANAAECKEELRRLPLLIETPGQRRRKNELDEKMREIEAALAIFKRPKVFIHEDV